MDQGEPAPAEKPARVPARPKPTPHLVPPKPSAPPVDPSVEPLKVGLPPHELARELLRRVEEASAYSRGRKERFRRNSSVLKLAGLGLSATATILLGWQNLDAWTGLAFSLIALTTVVGALEPFFAWRSLWVLMEESQHRFHRLRDDLAFYLSSTGPEDLDPERIHRMFAEYQEIWAGQSNRWLEFRRLNDR
ncbi:SLATT domain-containing protein [Actinosynnema sp. NPDC020468]|uniref:SLATT domain-containing protein n=1 Tax=Actinosynnema sp. NPDC020468 TaxID=3154488 RepID=UPI0033E6C095